MILDRLYKLLCSVIVVCMALMTVMVFVNTVLRYTTSTSIISSEEFSRFLFVWMIFIGCIIAVADDIHIKVDLFTKRLPPNIQRILSIIVGIGLVSICLILAVGGYMQTVLNVHNYAPATDVPLAYVYVSVFISGIAMAGIYFVRLLKLFASPKEGGSSK